jgi:hypothetical protein
MFIALVKSLQVKNKNKTLQSDVACDSNDVLIGRPTAFFIMKYRT